MARVSSGHCARRGVGFTAVGEAAAFTGFVRLAWLPPSHSHRPFLSFPPLGRDGGGGGRPPRRYVRREAEIRGGRDRDFTLVAACTTTEVTCDARPAAPSSSPPWTVGGPRRGKLGGLWSGRRRTAVRGSARPRAGAGSEGWGADGRRHGELDDVHGGGASMAAVGPLRRWARRPDSDPLLAPTTPICRRFVLHCSFGENARAVAPDNQILVHLARLEIINAAAFQSALNMLREILVVGSAVQATSLIENMGARSRAVEETRKQSDELSRSKDRHW
ncbi:hypothetical protein EJB05_32886, partial [Eragrostis curvula]